MSEPEAEPEQTPRKAGRPRSAQSHQAILNATIELFAEVGWQGLSIEAIAERAGVGKTTIYRRWSSKEELILDAINMMRDVPDIADTGNIRTDLINMMQLTQEMKQRAPLLLKCIMRLIIEIQGNSEFFKFLHAHMLAPRLEQGVQLIRRAQERGELRQDLDIEFIFSLVGGPIFYQLFVADMLQLPSVGYQPERVVDAILEGIGWQSLPKE